jgi:hypothetical protein
VLVGFDCYLRFGLNFYALLHLGHLGYALSTSASASAPGGAGGLGAASPLGAPRNSLLGRLGIRKPSLLSLAPSSPKDGSAPRTFSLDDLLRRKLNGDRKLSNLCADRN